MNLNIKILALMLIAVAWGLPAAAQQGVTVGGYGELHYNDVVYDGNASETPPGELDFHRFILYLGYDFNDWISFRSELELEHTLVEPDEGGIIALEQAYVDLRFKPTIGMRAGILLVPVGIINPVHEPPTFNGVERPNVEKYIIPTTWRESGIGIYGRFQSGLSYQAYLMAGLDTDGLSGGNGIRGARQKSFEASTDNISATARLDYQANLNWKFGASYFFSDLSANAVYGSLMEGSMLHMGEAHMIFQKEGFETRALFVYSTIPNVDQVNTTLGKDVGESQYGGYLELSYDLLRLGNTDTDQQLNLFARGEVYDTQFTTVNVPDNPENERYEYTFGLTYKPESRVALKADYQLLQTAGVQDIHQLNLGIGYNF